MASAHAKKVLKHAQDRVGERILTVMDSLHVDPKMSANPRAVRILFASIYLCAPVTAGAGLSCSYDVELLWGQTCGIFGPAPLFVSDIAPDGTIVGQVEQCAEPGSDEGFVWPSKDGPYIIPRPDGVPHLTAICINQHGQVGVFMSFGFAGHIYDIETGAFSSIGIPPGGLHSTPYGINDNGHVVGEWGNTLVGPTSQAFYWTGGDKPLDLTPLLFGPKAIAFDVNNNGQVVGWSGISITGSHTAFLWQQESGAINLGPIPGGTTSTARHINELGQVAVNGSIPNPSGSGMVGRPFLWEQGVWTELGILPGFAGCSASDINDKSQIIGECNNPGTSDESWYLWQEGAMTDLAPLIPTVVGNIEIEVDGVIAINNAGQIAANGTAWHPLFVAPSRVGLRLTPKFHSPADFTGDCHVDSKDLGILLGSWGPVGKRNGNPAADLDGNGAVNGFDLAMLLASWG